MKSILCLKKALCLIIASVLAVCCFPIFAKAAAETASNEQSHIARQGAKAGNLNHALSLTASPYVVTFDAISGNFVRCCRCRQSLL